MAREFEYDSLASGTLPLTGAAGERYADPTVADSSARIERDSTAYSVPTGDPFGDALAEQYSQPALIEPVPVPKVQPAPAPPPQQTQRPAPGRQEAPRRTQRPPSRPALPPQRQPQRQQPQRQPQPQRQQPQRQQTQRQQQQRQQPQRQQQRPALKQAKEPLNRLTTDLTKRPSLRKQQAPSRVRPRQSRGSNSSMARFPTNTGRTPHPAEAAAPPRRAKNIRPIWPIIIFLIILVALVRGCADSLHHDGSIAPTVSITSLR
jgi:hypothetical protein